MKYDDQYPPQSPYSTGLAGRCPRCGDGHLFNGFLDIAEKCDNCGMEFKFADAGDGPAVFVTLLAGFLLLGMALFVQMKLNAYICGVTPIATPLTLGCCVGMLRPLKGLLVALQYRNKAEQGRLE